MLALPVSSTGLAGFISLRTLALVALLRQRGHRFCIISGMRYATFMTRLHTLPAADAYVIENGGRIFHADGSRGTAAAMVEDTEWRRVHAAAGPASQETLPPAQRTGPLWEAHRALLALGTVCCDAASYTTLVRVSAGAGGEAALAAALAALPPSLTCAWNLGAADVFPATSGKAAALRYLAARWGVAADDERCVCMGDDDNDVRMAAAASHAFLPGVNAPTLAAAVAAQPQRFTVSAEAAFAATEDCLQRVAARFDALAPPQWFAI